MTKSLIVAAGAAIVLAAAALGPTRAGTAGPAIFTRSQVSAGEKTYGARCAKCHGANLEGISAPALRGVGSGLSGDSVAEAFTFMSTQMPAGDPGSLSGGQYADVLAFILSRNGHAAGSVALTPGVASKSKLKL